MQESRINTGGMMRCCIQTILDDPGPDTEDREIECKYCKEPIHFKDKTWKWTFKERDNG